MENTKKRDEMKLLYTTNEGITAWATLEAKLSEGYYDGYITIGEIRKQILYGMVNRNDTFHALINILGYYKENAVI